MSDYRAYIVDKEGHIKSAKVIVADDDEKAVEAAKPMVDGHDIEIWHLDRKVAVLPHQDSSAPE